MNLGKFISALFIAVFPVICFAQDNKVSGLDKENFDKYWCVESESPDYKVSFSGDTCELVSP